MNEIRTYFLSLTAAAFLGSLCMALTPSGGVRKVTSLALSLLLALAALTPLRSLDERTLAQALTRLQLQTEQVRTDTAVRNAELRSRIIKQTCETYILDKAANLGLQLEAEIELDDPGSGLYPSQVTLTGTPDAAQLNALTVFIRDQLGIPKERQVWKTP